MDREIAPEKLRKSKLKNYSKLAGILVLVAAGLLAFRFALRTSENRSSLRTSLVTQGPIEASLNATGVLVPENEAVVTSPIQARLEAVLHHAGEKINANQSILQLDKEYTKLAYRKLQDEQQLNQNETSKLQLKLTKEVSELQSRYNIKQMQVKRLQAALSDEKYLLSIGGGTEENVRQAEMNLKVAQLEADQLAAQIRQQQQANSADLKDVGFEMSIQERNLQEMQRKLDQADIKSPISGVLTFVNEEIGATVNPGDALVRVADLSSFKVKATIADSYADQLQPGGPVTVRLNDTDLKGTIATIRPAVENNQVTFFVQLDQKNHPQLRSNLKVEVFVITSFKNQAMRVKNGPFFTGARDQKVFVIKGNKAIARTVQIGLSNFDWVELLGVQPGEEVIISDTKEFQHLDEFTITND
ncbi:HlyD family efflux transporter periplasmic adaptor subunit [Adhaeribacter swui]|uniref:HlyD family efflux transporter periplasmic adaptor subunit n=1 Tax=Adhaeribacter swui TaxID=2086471 RepID=A0A7G7G460_9BACT|nr:HlyD family efflux transporter periplasmic adaptor subunit [Adhaeribacter swui]QNF31944.1 HlyD family efflux transporter periplasmic adaptor subunit [Adhaeribacter swui]